ncbi:TetR/AcrR family transcriptional regulator [Microbispora sp. NPDC049125]|uniref:TetR/AcrR family transcriptional regulator n=1 Tax=Microbispora sp. NPDC049125 TaxID=3154929 RepID=UPI0034664C74
MGRRPQRDIRDRLLAACTDHVLLHGLPPGLSAFAAGAGTSPRMLIYHFGTRERLLREVLAEARRRQLGLFHEVLEPRGEPYTRTLARAWGVLTGPEGAPFLRLFGMVHNTPEGRSLWPDFRRAATTDWLEVLERGLRPARGDAAPATATAVLAVMRGLLLDRDATGDTARADAAFAAFLGFLDLPGPGFAGSGTEGAGPVP